MNLQKLIQLFSDKKCNRIYVKELQRNNNSKQQIYIASGDTEILNLFPVNEFYAVESGKRKTTSFHAPFRFFWLNDEGETDLAPQAKFILYPDYPEVRFSGFLQGSKRAPSEILNNKVRGRLLFFGITEEGSVFGFATNPDSEIANEFNQLPDLEKSGILYSLAIDSNKLVLNSKEKLLNALRKIHEKGWIESYRLNNKGQSVECNAPQCGGYTLEAELGITPNGFAAPDFLGWEVKQFGVSTFERLNSSVITLMTPEPDGGLYVKDGVREFLRRYGYPDRNIENRINFGGIYKNSVLNSKTSIKLHVDGYDLEKSRISNPNGGIILLDSGDNIAASWSFASILKHWNKKHAKASYIPSRSQIGQTRRYLYGNKIILGEGTDFSYFLKQVASGCIYYDPALKLYFEDGQERDKRRNQFRIKSKSIRTLYRHSEIIDLKKA